MSRYDQGVGRARFPFPDRPRLWGVAVSHYQVEGNDPCDWTEWERAGRTKDPCGDAAGSWERYEEDAVLAASAGSNAFRFSVSWSRIEPEEGRWDDRALERYVRLADSLLRLDIEPVVTLFHYTHPVWFHERTPWSSPQSVEAFTRFARRVAEAFGERVRMWTVLNEPLVFLLAGYIDGQIPPGHASPSLARRALEHLLLAHASAAAAIRAVNPAAAIGLAHNMMAFAPERAWNPLDRLLSHFADRFYNRSLLEALTTGRWSFHLPPATWLRGRCDDLPSSVDFIGVNLYSRLHLRCPGRRRAIGDFDYRDRSGLGFTDNGWEIAPSTALPLLRIAAETGLPIVVTENGLADASDRHRAAYLEAYAGELRKAEGEGIPIAGYLHWSLLDNFEWLDGYGPKFGLFELDRATLERRPRKSVETFRTLGERFLSAGEGASPRLTPPAAMRR
ncbi:MAG: glycoside hydrolase family 1 protein [Thermoanaerobaculia bacterium]